MEERALSAQPRDLAGLAAAVVSELGGGTPRSLGPALVDAAQGPSPVLDLIPVLGQLMRVDAPRLPLQRAVSSLLFSMMMDAHARGCQDAARRLLEFVRLFLETRNLYAPGWRRAVVRTAAGLLGPAALEAVLVALNEGSDLARYAWVPRFFGQNSTCSPQQIARLLQRPHAAASVLVVAEVLRHMGVAEDAIERLCSDLPEHAQVLLASRPLRASVA